MQPQLVSPRDQGLMVAVTELAHRLHLPTTFVKFLVVGGFGFLVAEMALFILYDSPAFWFLPSKDTSVDFGPYTHSDIRFLIATVMAIETAIAVQFNAHERWTFRHRTRELWILRRFVKFNLSAGVGAVINIVVANIVKLEFGVFPYAAIAVGVLVGFTWNWTINTLVVWPSALKTALPAAPE